MRRILLFLAIFVAFAANASAQTSGQKPTSIFPDGVDLSLGLANSGMPVEFSFDYGYVKVFRDYRVYSNENRRDEIVPHVEIRFCTNEGGFGFGDCTRAIYIPLTPTGLTTVLFTANTDSRLQKTKVAIQDNVPGPGHYSVNFSFATERGLKSWRKTFVRAGLVLLSFDGARDDAPVRFEKADYIDSCEIEKGCKLVLVPAKP